MPRFTCKACGEAFEVPQRSIDRYPAWTPRYCRAHSPQKGRRKPVVEENLTLAQVPESPGDGTGQRSNGKYELTGPNAASSIAKRKYHSPSLTGI